MCIASLDDGVSALATSQQTGDAPDNAVRQNVMDNVAKLKIDAPILDAGSVAEVQAVGGIYRLRSGKVEMVS